MLHWLHNRWIWSLLLLGLLVGSAHATANQSPLAAIPAQPQLLIGQSNQRAWENFSQLGGTPAGGSIYYEVRGAKFNQGKNGVEIHRQYADFLAARNQYIQIGVSWKDNPPGWSGTGDNAPASRQATLDIATGRYNSNFQPLIDYINSHPNGKFLLRIDYEVSSAFHCTSSDCSSYKNAYNYLAQLIRSRTTAGNVEFIYHPVRGEFAQLYPGDTNVDWIGLSVFNHELCLPIYDQGTYQYNGTPGIGFDTQTNQCKGYVLRRDNTGNLNATPHNFDYDFNVLSMLKFAKDHAKPMILAESAPMNFAPGQNSNGTEADAMVTTWVQRMFGLMSYNGPLPNQEGSHNLSGVVKAIVYMNIDMRYGWDGYYGQSGFEFPYDANWFNNAQLSDYSQARQAFCTNLNNRGFSTRCGGTPQPTATPNQPQPSATPTPNTGGRDAYSRIEAESFNSQNGLQIVNSGVASGGAKVGYSNSGDWIKLSGVNFANTRPQQVVLRYSSPRTTAYVLEVRLDSPTGPLLASPGMNGTGGWDNFQTLSFNLSNATTGTRDVYVVWRANDSGSIADLDWLSFTR